MLLHRSVCPFFSRLFQRFFFYNEGQEELIKNYLAELLRNEDVFFLLSVKNDLVVCVADEEKQS